MQDLDDIVARLREVSSVPETLAVSFDAFEVIRLAARAHEDRVPGLFAAFMTTADAVVTGDLARLGALLSDRLAHAAAVAQAPGDKAACEQAAAAARQIRDLMARGHDDRGLW